MYFVPGERRIEKLYDFFLYGQTERKVYRLALKSLDFSGENPMGVRQSDKQLKRGKQIKYDMTEQQLDKVLIGKGLGDWMTWSSNRLQSYAVQAGHGKNGILVKGKDEGKSIFSGRIIRTKRLRIRDDI